MVDKTIDNYIGKLVTRVSFLEENQLGDNEYNQIMVRKELNVLESVIKDLQEIQSFKPSYRSSYWN